MKLPPRLFVLFAVACCLSIAVASSTARAGDGTTKIAIANTAKIFNEMQETRDLKQKFDNDHKTFDATNKEKQEKINTLKEARDQLRPDSPQYQDQNQQLLKATIEYQVWGQMQQADLERNQKQQTKILFDKIQSAVGDVAKQKGIELVIADQRPELPENLDQIKIEQLRALISQRNVLFATDKTDISADVIALLDSRYKSGGK